MDQRRDRGGARHRVWEPHVERELCGLSARTDEEAEPRQGQKRPGRKAGQEAEPGGKGHRAFCHEPYVLPHRVKLDGGMARLEERPKQQEDAEQEAEVADAVDDEGLLPAHGVVVIQVPEADQQVRTKADSLPPHKEDEQVVAQDQHQHREREEVQVAEKALESAVIPMVFPHVADGVDMNERAHAGNHQDHDRRERIQQQRELGEEITRANPGVEIVDEEALPRGERGCQLEDLPQRERERQHGRPAAKTDHEGPRELPAGEDQPEPAQQRAHERKQRNPADRLVHMFQQGPSPTT